MDTEAIDFPGGRYGHTTCLAQHRDAIMDFIELEVNVGCA
jgi:hypothetical protein